MKKSKRRELREEVLSLWIGDRKDMPMAMNIFANHLLAVVDRENTILLGKIQDKIIDMPMTTLNDDDVKTDVLKIIREFI